MSYAWQLIDRGFFVRWKKLDVVSLERILADVVNARRATTQPIIYVAVVPADQPVPAATERAALSEFSAKLRDHCEEAYMVIEGDSFKHSIQRTAMTSVFFLLQRGNAMPIHVHKHFDETLRLVAPKLNRQADELLRALRTRGFVTP